MDHPLHLQTKFSLQIFDKVWKLQDGKQNTIISPLSITVALAMAAAGARGKTLEELSSVLGLPQETMHDVGRELNSVLAASGSSGGPTLSSANAFWIDEKFQVSEDFRSLVSSHYLAEVSAANFEKEAERYVELINAWVADKTKGKIKSVLASGSLNANTKLVLANAVYFKGLWENQFDPRHTEDGVFQLQSGNITTSMMRRRGGHFIRRFDKFSLLRLPYQRGDDRRSFAMYILLPHDRDGLPELVESVRSNPKLMTTTLQSHIPEVQGAEVVLPKFKLTYSVDRLPSLLAQLGLKLPFSTGGDFSGIVKEGENNLPVLDVCHKALVEVNEEGTEAAAVTVIKLRYSFQEPVKFVADHPFLFVIKEDVSGALAFIGHVANPRDYSE